MISMTDKEIKALFVDIYTNEKIRIKPQSAETARIIARLLKEKK